MTTASPRLPLLRREGASGRTPHAVHVGIGLTADPVLPRDPFEPRTTEPPRRSAALIAALAARGETGVIFTNAVEAVGRPQGDPPYPVATIGSHRALSSLGWVRALASTLARAGEAGAVHVHLHDHRGWGLAAAFAMASTAPVLLHIHGSARRPLRVGSTGSARQRLAVAPLERRAMASAAGVVAASSVLAEAAQEAGAERVITVPPPALPPPLDPPGERPLSHLAGRRMVSIGPLIRRRRVTDVVTAMSSLPSDTRLFLLGDGPLRASIDGLVAQHGLRGRVHVIPQVGWHTAVAHIGHADLVVDASLAGEDPAVVQLAMQFGTPIVATRGEVVQDLVSDGMDGRLVPPGHAAELAGAMARALSDAASTATMAASARRRMRASSWLLAADRVRALAAAVAAR